MRRAPFGYINTLSPEGEKCIIPKEPEATWIRKTFELVAEGSLSISQIHKLTQSWGFTCSSSSFYKLLHHPVYCGKIVVPAFEQKKAYLTKGKHQGIVSVVLFEEVQKLLQNRAPKRRSSRPHDSLPLRGFIYCPLCQKRLTGSSSKGRFGKLYFYYHCRTPCRYRIRADHLNKYLIEALESLSPGEVYKSVLGDMMEELHLDIQRKMNLEHAQISKSMENLIGRGIKAHDLYLKGEIDAEDYMLIKSDCEKSTKALGAELRSLIRREVTTKKQARKVIRWLSHLDKLYQKLDFSSRQQLLSLLFKGKAVLETSGFAHATNRTTRLIFRLELSDKELKKTQQAKDEELENPYFKKIWQAEKRKGHILSLEQLSKCIAFLKNFYRLASN